MGFFKKVIFHILATAGVFWVIATHIFPETFIISGGFSGYAFAAVIFGILNTILKPILKLLTFPIRFLTLGVFSIFLNAGFLWIWEEVINFLEINGTSIEIKDLTTYFLAGIFLSIANSILHWIED
ncbi:phage holin family protein [Candidatus Gracilibacteria bacterium]|nr:phage holin family protein [Candidatus Gracilibacteria bacterium]